MFKCRLRVTISITVPLTFNTDPSDITVLKMTITTDNNNPVTITITNTQLTLSSIDESKWRFNLGKSRDYRANNMQIAKAYYFFCSIRKITNRRMELERAAVVQSKLPSSPLSQTRNKLIGVFNLMKIDFILGSFMLMAI